MGWFSHQLVFFFEFSSPGGVAQNMDEVRLMNHTWGALSRGTGKLLTSVFWGVWGWRDDGKGQERLLRV